MRAFNILFLIFAIGCSTTTHPLFFNIRSSDIETASAEPLEPKAGVFKAQIHLVCHEKASQRFRDFMERHAGQEFELRFNGEVFAANVCATPVSEGRDAWWYASSLEEAQHFATSLSRK